MEGKATRISALSKRYAKALFELCDPSSLDAIENMLRNFAEAFESDQGLYTALENPIFPADQRKAALIELVSRLEPADAKVITLAAILFDNGRLDILPEIAEFFSQLIQEYRRYLTLKVVTAQPLEQYEKDSTHHELYERLGRGLTIDWQTDSSLIGGAIIHVGDRVLDGSVKGMLDQATKQLIG